MHQLTLVIEFRGEAERIDLGLFASRRAAKRAALGDLFRRLAGRWPSRHSRAEAHVEIGGRPHGWLTEELAGIIAEQPTIGDLLRTQGWAVV